MEDGLYALDDAPALYVYEMRDPQDRATRGLMGALELRAPEDGVVLPHENTMAGPVEDRLRVMTETGTDLEPIYLVYDGGGPASEVVRTVDTTEPVARTTTPDGITHRLWALTDPEAHKIVADDLATRRAPDRRRPPPLRDLPRASAAATATATAPGRGTAASPSSSTRPTTGRRCTPSTG